MPVKLCLPQRRIYMSKPGGIASPTGSPFAVVVMFFGNGFVMESSYSRMPGYAISWALRPPSLRSRWSAWELDRSSACLLRGDLWIGIPHE